jgi:RNA polymerase sigma factor for flagellar operon FliA
MGTTRSGIQKYQKQQKQAPKSQKKSDGKSTAKESAVESSDVKAMLSSKAKAKAAADVQAAQASAQAAMEALTESKKKIQAEVALQKELEKELVQAVPYTNKLVAGDFSPVNMDRERLIVEYAGLIKFIASKIASRLPSNIELDDLISSGVIGLMDAIEKYDDQRDNKFKTYAEFRIRGAILDELRSQDWVPRSVREKAKILERAYARIEQDKGRTATDDEVCTQLGITTEQYHDLLNEVRSVSLLSYDDLGNLSNADKRSLHGMGEANSKVPTPFTEVNGAHVKQLVSEVIEDLPEKQRLVLSLYYYEDLNLKEIGRVLDVTESRVSQLHSQAILKLRARLKNHWDDFVNMISV